MDGTTVNTCSGTFMDDGGLGGNYTAGQNRTITFCAPAGQRVRIYFTQFNVDLTDGLYVYDGSSASAPLLAGENGMSLQGNYVESSGQCITFRFESDGTASTAAGWNASISCFTPCTTFPTAALGCVSDIYLCVGESVSLTGVNSTYTSPATGISLYNFVWSDQGTLISSGSPTISRTFTEPGIYLLNLQVRDNNFLSDPLGCQSLNSPQAFVYVTSPPTLSVSSTNSSICPGSSSTLTATYAPQSICTKRVPSIQNFALPDATGGTYKALLDVNNYPTGATVSSLCLPTVCIDIEHEWLNDLIISLTAPNGSVVTLHHRGGNPASADLGCATQGNNPPNGVCAKYCFVAHNSPLATQTLNQTSPTLVSCEDGTINQIAPGTYFASGTNGSTGGATGAGNMSVLTGSPINGTWSLNIQDNASLDDGTLCGWSMTFPESCQRTLDTCVYVCVDTIMNKPTWISATTNGNICSETFTGTNQTGTFSAIVAPTATGAHNYSAVVTDCYGCSRTVSTTVKVGGNNTLSLGASSTMICAGNPLTIAASSNITYSACQVTGNGSAGATASVSGSSSTISSSSNVTTAYYPGRTSWDSIQVKINVTTTDDLNDLVIRLTNPCGVSVILVNSSSGGASAGDFNTTFVSHGYMPSLGTTNAGVDGRRAPINSLAPMLACNTTGAWTLSAWDDQSAFNVAITSFSVSLFSSNGVNYSISNSMGLLNSGTNVTNLFQGRNITLVPTMTDTYKLEVTDFCGTCFLTTSVKVVVNPIDTAYAGPDITV